MRVEMYGRVRVQASIIWLPFKTNVWSAASLILFFVVLQTLTLPVIKLYLYHKQTTTAISGGATHGLDPISEKEKKRANIVYRSLFMFICRRY